jgi:hypothetical protein
MVPISRIASAALSSDRRHSGEDGSENGSPTPATMQSEAGNPALDRSVLT